MWDRIERVTAPRAEPLTLGEIKWQRRVDHTDEDALLVSLGKAARETIEGPDGVGVVLMASQWRLTLECLPSVIRIPMGPVMTIDSIAYVDEAGTTQTLEASKYQWSKMRFGAFIKPAYDLTWPIVRRQLNAATVTFTAGFQGTGDNPPKTDNIPEQLKQALHLLIGHWYENRETVVAGVAPVEVPLAYESIVNRFRVGRFV